MLKIYALIICERHILLGVKRMQPCNHFIVYYMKLLVKFNNGA